MKKLTATVIHNGYSSIRNWKINNFDECISYGGHIFNNSYKIYLNEGEGFTFPVPCKLSPEDIIFYHEHPLLNNATNCMNNLQISNNKVSCLNLEKGKYVLILLRLDRRVDFEVVKGETWIGGDIIDEDRTIYKVQKERNQIMLGDIQPSKREDGGWDCKVEIVSSQ